MTVQRRPPGSGTGHHCVGLISGTSADGIDAALVLIDGPGPRVELIAFRSTPYPAAVRHELLALYAPNAPDAIARLCSLNVVLGQLFADAAAEICRQAAVPIAALHVVGSHGQTVWHQPGPDPALPLSTRSALQIADPSVIAERLGAPVVADFRAADIAAGGQAAPLVPYFDWALLSRILYGARISLLVGVSSVLASALVGTLLGLVAGYVGRWPEYLITRVMDVIFAFPGVLLAILVISVVGAGFASIVIAIGTVYTPIFARVVRGSTLPLKQVEFVLAAVAAGASTGRVLWRHILPNVAAPILVQLALSLSGAVVLEAALSYLGLGAVPPTPSLGSMLSEARAYMELAPWSVLYPGLALGLLVLAINIFGDAVRDLLDPRFRGAA